MPEHTPPRQFVLDRRKVGAHMEVGADLLSSLDVRATEDRVAGRLAAQVSAFVLTERLLSDTAEASLEVPASWWQHYKRDQLYVGLNRDRIMRWVAHRWPVRYEERRVTMRFDRYAMFPHSNLGVDPHLGTPVWDDDPRVVPRNDA